MPTVNTVTGPVDTAQLGFTLMHEHIYVLSEGVVPNFPQLWNREARIRQAGETLRQAKQAGVNTIVDLTVLGLGRDVEMARQVSELSGVNVIAATGVYTYDELPHHFQNRDADYMADLFTQDITHGVQGTDIKAAILKVATDQQGVTQGVEKALRAVARAHRRTGAPISTHTHAATKRGLDQQRIFREEGVDLSRVVIGHSGDTEDTGYLEELMKAGSFIGMDRFGIDTELSSEKRVAVIARLCDRGYASHMVLSHDTSVYIDWFPPELIKQVVPRWNFLHISNDVLPMLRSAGVSDADIQTMTVDNPRRIFETHGAY